MMAHCAISHREDARFLFLLSDMTTSFSLHPVGFERCKAASRCDEAARSQRFCPLEQIPIRLHRIDCSRFLI